MISLDLHGIKSDEDSSIGVGSGGLMLSFQ